jgi:hypothetical protein
MDVCAAKPYVLGKIWATLCLSLDGAFTGHAKRLCSKEAKVSNLGARTDKLDMLSATSVHTYLDAARELTTTVIYCRYG